MPLIRIDAIEGRSKERVRGVLDAGSAFLAPAKLTRMSAVGMMPRTGNQSLELSLDQ